MPTVKIRNKKIYKNNTVTTIDKEHRNISEKFNLDQENLKKIEKKLKKKEKKLSKLEKIPLDECKKKVFKKKAHLKTKIQTLKNKIQEIRSYGKEIKYIEETGEILLEHYNDIDLSKLGNAIDFFEESKTETRVKTKKSALEKLHEERLKDKPKKPTVRKVKIKKTNSQKITKFLFAKSGEKSKIVTDKSDLRDKYMKIIDPNYKSKIKSVKKGKRCKNPKCRCEMRVMYNEGMYVCGKCGLVDDTIIITDGQNYKDQVKDSSGCPYDRRNHFNERLAQVQGKEATGVQDDEYEKIKAEIKKQRIKMADLDYKSLRKILKSIELYKYYEHIPYILCKLNKRKPLSLSREEEDILKYMFTLIQKPFKKHCPKSRSNFLSYWYVLYKFCEMLDWTHCLSYFPSLKTSNKLQEHDQIWKGICADLGWESYKSA